jgi:predicted transposase YbfD/YdcC
MEPHATIEMLRLFAGVPDHRADNAWHRLSDVIATAILAVFCGARGWYDVELWARHHQDWLKTFLALPHGIPSHDTFGRIFASLDSKAFEQCFMSWSSALVENGKKFIAIDGKALRQSYEHGWSRTPIHMVSAFVTTNQVILGQLKVDSKTNEIVAIPKLLELLDIRKATVTIDAIGCQKAICEQIVRQKGNYVIAVKENQPTLLDQIVRSFEDARLNAFAGWKHDKTSSVESGHGRIDKRRLWVTTDIAHMSVAREWPGLKSIIMVESTRELREGKSTERRYYISSHAKLDADGMAEAIRGHWKIENGLHRVLDVTMDEDGCRLRKKNSAENFSRLRRIALNKLRPMVVRNDKDKDMKVSVAAKQKLCAWDRNFLIHALLG